MHSDTDVLIVGAGPVGLTLALLIAQRGHRVAIYERWGAPFPLPRAVAISHDSLRTFQSAGVLADLEPVLAMSRHDQTAEYFDAQREVLMRQIMPGTDISGFPSMSGFNQPDLEAVLGRCCAEHPRVAVHRGWQARSAAQAAEGVTVMLDPSDGETTRPGDPIVAQARFVIGCDGANSSVRAMMATRVVDTGFASRWLVVDIKPGDGRIWEPEIGQSLDPARPTTIVPSGPGRRRFEIMALPGETAEMLTAEATVWRLIGAWGVEPGTAELIRSAVYTFHGRWAETWRDGRLLLAGDAAHQMPPFMGQGFNSGIRDAVALAWRLDLVLAGVAPAEILDSYGAERLPHVRQIVEQSVEIGKMICVTDPTAAAQRDRGLRLIRDHPEHASPPPPEWRLGPGILLPEDPHAGYLSLQATVETGGGRRSSTTRWRRRGDSSCSATRSIRSKR